MSPADLSHLRACVVETPHRSIGALAQAARIDEPRLRAFSAGAAALTDAELERLLQAMQ